ncbi:MAG: fatty acid CoA ligase family protein [Patescibacteria group bacterium]|nr:fatty acid CoA ligase family protein [Patescibacteria group bacterium]
MAGETQHNGNVARRLTEMAVRMPDATAVVEPLGYGPGGRQYRQMTFRELDQDSDRIAAGLQSMGAQQGTRLALLVRPGIDFVSLAFGLLKSGAVSILIDPGMGRKNLLRCLADAEPEGFVAIPLVHAVRTFVRGRFPKAKLNVTVGRRWFWDGTTLAHLRSGPWPGTTIAPTVLDSPAAIIFTTGSTGPPKGVLYSHGNFDAQVEQIRDRYGIQPGEIDLPGFPLFGLFNCAMGVTAVIPAMDPSRPAKVNPRNILEAAEDWQVTQTFGSPAIWNRVGRYCEEHGARMPSVRRVLSAGAPVPADVLERMRRHIAPEGELYTPYGATEALPVASISASEVLGGPGAQILMESEYDSHPESFVGTANRTRQGAGVCVGTRFSAIAWKVIRIVDGPIPSISGATELPSGEIGELIVRGPQVTREYVTRVDANATAKIADGESFWHRMGDTGYLDEQDRFWFCGRVAHRVLTEQGPMYPVRCEAIFNQHPDVFRSALVGVGPLGRQRPVIVVELHAGRTPSNSEEEAALLAELRDRALANPLTEVISAFLIHPAFPVDIRHNAKIFREKLADWATGKL